ncbi:hypothetical protein RJ639_030082 [Escallonia herrerae]|uniref:Uncharacterized protein n=1 Tax=Escallonia herrerae TaxID=1293975 RepID=A0AA88X205_9ASTE|nr:hypothetical protein RJ639_030082 [Escallonia herrerae]
MDFKGDENGVKKTMSPCDVEALKKCLKEHKGDHLKCQSHVEAFRSSCSLKKPNSPLQPASKVDIGSSPDIGCINIMYKRATLIIVNALGTPRFPKTDDTRRQPDMESPFSSSLFHSFCQLATLVFLEESGNLSVYLTVLTM